MKTYAARNPALVIQGGVLFLLAVTCGLVLPDRLAAQTRTNLAGSVTSESMTALWVARDRGLFKKHGLDMQFILMPRNPLAIAALLAGEIDAAIVGPGHVIKAASSGADLIGIANFAQKLDYRFCKNTGVILPQTMLVTTRRIAAGKPQLIEAYLKTMVEAIAVTFDLANKELVIRLLASNLRLTNPGDAEDSYQTVINSYERVPHPSLEGMKRLHKLLIQINPKVTDVRVENVIDTSFMNKLESSGYIQSVYKKH